MERAWWERLPVSPQALFRSQSDLYTLAFADEHTSAQQVAASLFAHAYKVGMQNLPNPHNAKSFTRMVARPLSGYWQGVPTICSLTSAEAHYKEIISVRP